MLFKRISQNEMWVSFTMTFEDWFSIRINELPVPENMKIRVIYPVHRYNEINKKEQNLTIKAKLIKSNNTIEIHLKKTYNFVRAAYFLFTSAPFQYLFSSFVLTRSIEFMMDVIKQHNEPKRYKSSVAYADTDFSYCTKPNTFFRFEVASNTCGDCLFTALGRQYYEYLQLTDSADLDEASPLRLRLLCAEFIVQHCQVEDPSYSEIQSVLAPFWHEKEKDDYKYLNSNDEDLDVRIQQFSNDVVEFFTCIQFPEFWGDAWAEFALTKNPTFPLEFAYLNVNNPTKPHIQDIQSSKLYFTFVLFTPGHYSVLKLCEAASNESHYLFYDQKAITKKNSDYSTVFRSVFSIHRFNDLSTLLLQQYFNGIQTIGGSRKRARETQHFKRKRRFSPHS